MKNLNKLLICLDLSELDSTVVGYAKYLNQLLHPKSISFLHVQSILDVPASIKTKYPEINDQIDPNIIRDFVEQTNGYSLTGTQLSFDVLEGGLLKNLLNHGKTQDIDLIVLGRNVQSETAGTLSKQVARTSKTQVLIVPNTSPQIITEILVPVDFSDYSKLALLDAIELAEHSKANITLIHMYEVPENYHRTGKSFEEFATILRQDALEQYQEYIHTIDIKNTSITPLLVLKDRNSHAKTILEKAADLGSDLIIIGARSTIDQHADLLGHTTEELLALNPNIAILVVKKKDKANLLS